MPCNFARTVGVDAFCKHDRRNFVLGIMKSLSNGTSMDFDARLDAFFLIHDKAHSSVISFKDLCHT